MVSSALLAAEDPLKADSDRNNVRENCFQYSYKFISSFKTCLNFFF